MWTIKTLTGLFRLPLDLSAFEQDNWTHKSAGLVVIVCVVSEVSLSESFSFSVNDNLQLERRKYLPEYIKPKHSLLAENELGLWAYILSVSNVTLVKRVSDVYRCV